MASRDLGPARKSISQNAMTFSEVFATVQQLSSQIDESRIPQVIDTVKEFEDKQLMVDLLSISLQEQEHHHILTNADRVLHLLTQIASSANVIARNRMLNHGHLTPETDASSGVYILQGDPRSRIRVLRRGKQDTPDSFSNALLTWVHLSHPNIVPAYGAFLDGSGGPVSIVSPLVAGGNIIDYVKTIIQAKRVALISGMIDGLCYLHGLNVVHGKLSPQSVLVSESGQACLTDLDALPNSPVIRYCAPELFENNDVRPTKAADVWALGCLCYEVLSGNVPFCQYQQEAWVPVAVVKGKRPIRPGQEGIKGEGIDDVLWRSVSACWELEPRERPSCPNLRGAFLNMNIHDERLTSMSPTRSVVRGDVEAPFTDLERTRSLSNRILGSSGLLLPPSQIPRDLREPLSGLVDNLGKVEAVAAAATKLKPVDLQLLLDALDLVITENSSFLCGNNPIMKLVRGLIKSTQIYPQWFKLRPLLYDPSSISETKYGKTYEGRDFHVSVSVVTHPNGATGSIGIALSQWVHSCHPNVLPFYGLFNESVNDVLHLHIVSPYIKNGTLHECAPRLPKKSRIHLIRDVIDGLDYIHHQCRYVLSILTPASILISNEGRALIVCFNAAPIVIQTTKEVVLSSALYERRFDAPEYLKTYEPTMESDRWQFGCICYEVLSKKPPYHEYTDEDQVRSALSRGELPKRPTTTDNDIDVIDDQLWKLITGCCRLDPRNRLTIPEIKKLLITLRLQDDRPDARELPGTAIMNLRKRPDLDWARVKQVLGQIQVELLRDPLSKLLRHHINDVAMEVLDLRSDDVQILVNFLDATLTGHLTISEERNRVLALLAKIMTSAKVFPERLKLEDTRYYPEPVAAGGFGTVHRGASDPNICVKVMRRVNDSHALIAYTKELILWAHSSHPNILPFYGAFLNDAQQICLVSPYMAKGNLSDYVRRLPQKSRIPLLLDTAKGLNYLHGLGIVHTDLKGENVLISNEGRALITDFGASHIVTVSARGEGGSAALVCTLRFTAPEIIKDEAHRARPTSECDMWSFGCLCYEALSRKLPYYEYRLNTHVYAALLRGQPPKRPVLTKIYHDNSYDDDRDVNDYDNLDDTTWNLISTCFAIKPEDRPTALRIQEMILDVMTSDPRPSTKIMPKPGALKQKLDAEVDLNHARGLLDHLQVLFLAQSVFWYSDIDVAAAVASLGLDDVKLLARFWAWALHEHLSAPGHRRHLLALITKIINGSRQVFTAGYCLKTHPHFHPESIGEGSFGKLYREPELNICVKHTTVPRSGDRHLNAQWERTIAPWAHSSHPNVLPFYGMSFGRSGKYLVTPFIGNGNIGRHAASLPHESRMLLISDVVEGLIYLHDLGIIHGNLKVQNVLVSDEGRGLITDFRPYYINIAAAANAPTGPSITSTLRYTAPELVKDSQMLPTTASDVWSVGCLIYEVFSHKVPYYKYSKDPQIRFALSRDELPTGPVSENRHVEGIDDKYWDLIMQCWDINPERRPNPGEIQAWIQSLNLEDPRPSSKPLPGSKIFTNQRPFKAVELRLVEDVLDKLKARLPKIIDKKVNDESMVKDQEAKDQEMRGHKKWGRFSVVLKKPFKR